MRHDMRGKESPLFRKTAADACAAPVPERQEEVRVDAGGGGAAPVPSLGDEVVGVVKVLGKAAGHLYKWSVIFASSRVT